MKKRDATAVVRRFPRRRVRLLLILATVLAIALIAIIESGARELFFGVLFINLVLVFDTADAVRRWLPVTLALYAGALVVNGLDLSWYLN